MSAIRMVVALCLVLPLTAAADWVAPGNVWTGTSWINAGNANVPVGSVLISNTSSPVVWTGQAWVDQGTWMGPKYAGGNVWTGTGWVPENANTNTVGFVRFSSNGVRQTWNGSSWSPDPKWAGIQRINGKVWTSGKWVPVYRQAATPRRIAPTHPAGRGGTTGGGGQSAGDNAGLSPSSIGSGSGGGGGSGGSNSGGGSSPFPASSVSSGGGGNNNSGGGGGPGPSNSGPAPIAGALNTSVVAPSSAGNGSSGVTGSGNPGGGTSGTGGPTSGGAPSAGGSFSAGGGGSTLTSGGSNPALGSAALVPNGANTASNNAAGSTGQTAPANTLILDTALDGVGGGRQGYSAGMHAPANSTFDTNTLGTNDHVFTTAIGGGDPVSVERVGTTTIGLVTPITKDTTTVDTVVTQPGVTTSTVDAHPTLDRTTSVVDAPTTDDVAPTTTTKTGTTVTSWDSPKAGTWSQGSAGVADKTLTTGTTALEGERAPAAVAPAY